MNTLRIKKDDTVQVLAGKDRGKTGKVLAIFREKRRVTIDGVNVYKKRTRPRKQGEKGEVVEVARSMHLSNVALVCKGCKKPVRVGKREEGGKKVRYCKKCDATV